MLLSSNPNIVSEGGHVQGLTFSLLFSALNASVSGIIITDNQQPDNPIIYCNTAFEKISGYSRSEIIGHNCRFLQGKDRSQKARQQIAVAVEKAESCKVEIRNYRKNGDLFWNELFMAPVSDASGKVTHFIGVQNDITLREKAELELLEQKAVMEEQVRERTIKLKENEAFLSSIIETVRESLLVLDPDFKVISANDHFFKTFKVSSQETIGKLLYDLGNGQWNIEKLKELLLKILPTNNPVLDFEVEHEFPHIGKKLMLLNAYRIELEGQYKDRILIAIEDITERREIERRKDDFLSIASHELKTPLTSIKGFLQMLSRLQPAGMPDQYQVIFDKVNVSVDRLNMLITDLLDVSRIQSGNMEIHKDNFDFDKVVAETIEQMQSVSPDHTIISTGSSRALVKADEQQIVQVINNLLANAIKYSPDSKEIYVHISKVSDYVKLSVRDTGVGINLEDQQRVFQRFFRGAEFQKKFAGMGIGLYVCEQIIKNHNGTIWLNSEKGQGTTFNFTIPIEA
ncbi:PAS domain-containing sensor histidine kinase [Niabella hibiscisoli]|uniref:PAS domain-containing sensor histidine kinase n=1 Tax=Niabella hibiscisoli TaxID=1825928 RepID=UPI001F0F14D1|nr:PAS domain-containing sensor histidine kinase [Niabella hibiscisoli]MCH5719103.1 PAS domain-containing protein [Niabella hibiscisoli]